MNLMALKQMELANKLRGPLDGAPPKEREPYIFALKVMGTVSEALAWDNTITKVWNYERTLCCCCFTNDGSMHD